MTEKKDWVLRIEGVNLGATVFNTNDLSTIRGSSMVLEVFGFELSKGLVEPPGEVVIDVIYRAAAQAAFRLNGLTESQALAAKAKVQSILQRWYFQGPLEPHFVSPHILKKINLGAYGAEDVQNLAMPSEHMTFVIELTPVDPQTSENHDPERYAVNTTLMASRRQQLRTPNLPRSPAAIAISGKVEDRSAVQCTIDPVQQLGQNKDESSFWVNQDQFPTAPELQKDGKWRRKRFFKTLC